MIQKFKKKPVEIEAIRFNGNSNKQEVESFVGKELKSELESEAAYVAGKGPPIFSLLIETKEGIMKAMKGDWIIKEPFPTGDRDFYPCKNDIFINTYELKMKTYIIDAETSLRILKNWIIEARDKTESLAVFKDKANIGSTKILRLKITEK